MKIHCLQCGKLLHPGYRFCPFCAAEAPAKTIIGKIEPQKITAGIYCSCCSHLNPEDAFYCTACSHDLYHRPDQNSLYCPVCSEKNPVQANYCCKCNLYLNDWFEMKGKVAEKLGLRGNITLKEKMTGIRYHIFTQDEITMGRAEDNDIVIPCQWVSGKHCRFDLKKGKLIDLDSKNGLYCNWNKDRIKSKSLPAINGFNLAGTFTFSNQHSENIFLFRLTAIIDEKECCQVSDFNIIKNLRSTYFILLWGDSDFCIRKLDGKIVLKPELENEFYQISYFNKCY